MQHILHVQTFQTVPLLKIYIETFKQVEEKDLFQQWVFLHDAGQRVNIQSADMRKVASEYSAVESLGSKGPVCSDEVTCIPCCKVWRVGSQISGSRLV